MGRPEQHGKSEHAKKCLGKHQTGLRPDGQKTLAGAFAPGNTLAKGQGERISKGMQLRNALRDQVGEERVRQIVDELYEMAITKSLEPKDRIAAAKTILDYAVGKPAQEMAIGAEMSKDGTTRIMFVVKDDNGDEKEL